MDIGSLAGNISSIGLEESCRCAFVRRINGRFVKNEQENLLDRIAILPDQYGNFKIVSELSINSGEINEILKDA
ncbi:MULTISPECIES: hypothetical protein [Paenibacillus]|uniref:Uncharacterized protein n=1 Tax=Paenibacillus lautus TaxID=1401 RepID=A0A1R1AKT0_PAELA|nr:hypothetical protein [Paenibacillus lautus]OME86017.1 hypothetical protein BK123_33385 [Paenibacillus lautus]